MSLTAADGLTSGIGLDGDPLARVRRGRRRLPSSTRILGYLSIAYLVLVCVAAVFASSIAPHSPINGVLPDRLLSPGWLHGKYLLGTDSLGRDILSRIIYGARTTLIIGFSVVVLSGLFGTVAGLVAGYRGGWVDQVIMRVADAQLAFPGLLLTIIVIGVEGPSTPVLIVVIAVYGWMVYARLVRALVLRLREEQFVRAAEMSGSKTPFILRKHLLPNLLPALMTQALLELARVILVEASLSYLGLGVQPPHASWGLMVSENQGYVSQAWWTVVCPGVALALTVLATNLVARVVAGGAVNPAASQWAIEPSGQATAERVDESSSITTPGPVLSVRDLTVSFAGAADDLVHAVQGVSFDIRPGEVLGVVGESGSGKSVSMASVLGILPDGARVGARSLEWRGKRISFEDLHRMRGRDISIIFQNPMSTLDPLMPVGRQIAEVLRKSKKMGRAAARARAIELLDLVGIPDPEQRYRQFPFEFSGGMAQRVAIALAVAPEPALLVADEPTTALDVTVQAQVLSLLKEVQQRLDIAIIFITHDLGVVRGIAHRCLVMYAGRVVEEGPTQSLFEAAQHPYTAALIAATPDVNDRRDELAPIPGDPAVAGAPTLSCAFAPRCSYSTEVCRQDLPILQIAAASATEPGRIRRVACWHEDSIVEAGAHR
ncbi:MAG TPA: dipeptide/oligopeptide/nickel ABC transporter permease/ATP-binding protein [Mycobacteriales bacterium]|jgi:peptide/nickel transport system permease protein|nr:dipeptide/oligopeptide/nickel ABC transporter permease/ATP-binding protein [Mycobacteriales bacterium]